MKTCEHSRLQLGAIRGALVAVRRRRRARGRRELASWALRAASRRPGEGASGLPAGLPRSRPGGGACRFVRLRAPHLDPSHRPGQVVLGRQRVRGGSPCVLRRRNGGARRRPPSADGARRRLCRDRGDLLAGCGPWRAGSGHRRWRRERGSWCGGAARQSWKARGAVCHIHPRRAIEWALRRGGWSQQEHAAAKHSTQHEPLQVARSHLMHCTALAVSRSAALYFCHCMLGSRWRLILQVRGTVRRDLGSTVSNGARKLYVGSKSRRMFYLR
jgi:hypothetical protein